MKSRRLVATLGGLGVLLCWACAPPLTPEEEVSNLRMQYEAELKSFTVTQEPQTADVSEGEDEETDDGVEAPAPTVRSDALLDILVSTTATERLPGITVEVQQVDAAGKEKATGLLWVDTSTLGRGNGVQVTHVLEDITYDAGDGFWVGVRSSIPASEYGKYKEFSAP